MQTLAIFDALSTADIRFQSVDVSEVQEDRHNEQSSQGAPFVLISSLVLLFSGSDDQSEKKRETVDDEKSRWRKIVQRERGFTTEWREKVFGMLFPSSSHQESSGRKEDNDAVLELPQVWAVFENEMSSAVGKQGNSFGSYTRVQIFKVKFFVPT